VLNAVVWTAGVEVPKDGVKSKPLTEDELNANLDDKGKAARLTVVKPGEFKQIPTAPVDTKREAAFPQDGPRKFENAGKSPAARKGGVVKPVAESPSMNAKSARLHEIKAKIEDAKELYLVVSDNGDMAFDWADWIEPKIFFKDGTSKDLGDLPWTSATTGWGDAKVGWQERWRPNADDRQEDLRQGHRHACRIGHRLQAAGERPWLHGQGWCR
jgi:hypothetical protein